MKGFNPYLNYNGNCREALNFYKECFGGEIVSIQTFADAQMAEGQAERDKIMHAVFKAGSVYFMASDCGPGQSVTPGTNVTLNVDFDNVADQEKVFNKLSSGGTVTMPLQDTFWGAHFGMLTDKFGINWMTNCDVKK